MPKKRLSLSLAFMGACSVFENVSQRETYFSHTEIVLVAFLPQAVYTKVVFLALENVTGLLSTDGGENYRLLHNEIVNRGYKFGAIVLNASHFVPQSRPRVFVIAAYLPS